MATLSTIESEFFSQAQNSEVDQLTAVPQELIDSEFTAITETLEADRNSQEEFADLVDEIDNVTSPELKERLDRELCCKSSSFDLQTMIKT